MIVDSTNIFCLQIQCKMRPFTWLMWSISSKMIHEKIDFFIRNLLDSANHASKTVLHDGRVILDSSSGEAYSIYPFCEHSFRDFVFDQILQIAKWNSHYCTKKPYFPEISIPLESSLLELWTPALYVKLHKRAETIYRTKQKNQRGWKEFKLMISIVKFLIITCNLDSNL